MRNAEVFHLKVHGEQRGPYTINQIEHLLHSGLVEADALFWREGLEEWQPVTQLVVPRRQQKRTWFNRPLRLVAGIVLLAIFARIFGPIAVVGWLEASQPRYTEAAAYWRARDAVRQSPAVRASVVEFLGRKTAVAQLEPPDGATVTVRGKITDPAGQSRLAAWRVRLQYAPKAKEWRGVEVTEVPG